PYEYLQRVLAQESDRLTGRGGCDEGEGAAETIDQSGERREIKQAPERQRSFPVEEPVKIRRRLLPRQEMPVPRYEKHAYHCKANSRPRERCAQLFEVRHRSKTEIYAGNEQQLPGHEIEIAGSFRQCGHPVSLRSRQPQTSAYGDQVVKPISHQRPNHSREQQEEDAIHPQDIGVGWGRNEEHELAP